MLALFFIFKYFWNRQNVCFWNIYVRKESSMDFYVLFLYSWNFVLWSINISGSFVNCIREANQSAQKLLEIIVTNFSHFKDEAVYQNIMGIWRFYRTHCTSMWPKFEIFMYKFQLLYTKELKFSLAICGPVLKALVLENFLILTQLQCLQIIGKYTVNNLETNLK